MNADRQFKKNKRLHGSVQGGLLPWKRRGVDRAAMLGVYLESEGLLLLVPQDRDLDGLAHVGAEIAVPIGGGVDGIRTDLENHVECLEARGGSFALPRHLLDHEAARDAK